MDTIRTERFSFNGSSYEWSIECSYDRDRKFTGGKLYRHDWATNKTVFDRMLTVGECQSMPAYYNAIAKLGLYL